MKVNGIDVNLYSENKTLETIQQVLQYLEVFECCTELTIALREFVSTTKRDIDRLRGEASRQYERDRKPRVREPIPLTLVTGKCSSCGGVLKGLPIPGCEARETGRTFYEQCDDCSYYRVVYKDKDNSVREELSIY